MQRFAVCLVFVVVACTGGGGSLDGDGGTSSSGGSSGGTNQQIRASEFSQSCVDDTDCTAVYEGAICSQCGCPNAGIAKSALSDYTAKRQSAGCPQTDVDCAACANVAVTCAQGVCRVGSAATPISDSGAD